MSSRIEQIIDEIEEYIDHCKFQPLSTTKIIVNKDQIDELLRELRMKTPEEIKRYQKIIDNKDAIIADAQSPPGNGRGNSGVPWHPARSRSGQKTFAPPPSRLLVWAEVPLVPLLPH